MRAYKATVAAMTLTDALPNLHGNRFAEVRDLDAERVRLAEAYEAADGALLAKIRHRLVSEGGGVWGHYRDARVLPGSTVYDRLRIAEQRPVAIARFSPSAAWARTHCRHCEYLLNQCRCGDEADALAAHGFLAEAERVRIPQEPTP